MISGSRLSSITMIWSRIARMQASEETAPAVIGIAVIVPIAVLVAVVTAITLLIWLVLR